MTSKNQYGVNVRKYRSDAGSISVTVRDAHKVGDQPRDYGTLAYYIGGIATGTVILKEDGKIQQGTGAAWAEACGVGDTEKGEFKGIVAKRRMTLAKAAVAAYEARLAEDGVSVSWQEADDDTIHAAIVDMLSVGSLEGQYQPASKVKEDSIAKIVADAIRRADAIGARYEDLLAALEDATLGSGLAE